MVVCCCLSQCVNNVPCHLCRHNPHKYWMAAMQSFHYLSSTSTSTVQTPVYSVTDFCPIASWITISNSSLKLPSTIFLVYSGRSHLSGLQNCSPLYSRSRRCVPIVVSAWHPCIANCSITELSQLLSDPLVAYAHTTWIQPIKRQCWNVSCQVIWF